MNLDAHGPTLAGAPPDHPALGPACRAWLDSVRDTGISAAAIARTESGHISEVLHSSDALGARLFEWQAVTGEGPAVTALTEGGPMFVPDLRADPAAAPWVGFVREADALGVRTYAAVPLQIGVIALGVFGIHGPRAMCLDDARIATLFELTDSLSPTLLGLLSRSLAVGHQGGAPTGTTSAHPSPLGRDSTVIHQATGMIAVQIGGTMEEALITLRAHAYGSGRTLADTARDVVDRRLFLAHPPAHPPEDGNGAQRAPQGRA